jgi:hypothetical protein
MLTRARLLLTGFVLVLLVVASRPAYADGVGVGAKIGPLFPSISSDNITNFKNRTGWMGGIWFGGNRAGTVGIMGEVLYAKKNVPDPLFGLDTDLHYLEIPILLRINVGSANRERVAGYIIAGPAFDVKLKAELNGIDIAEQYEGLDLGVIAGAGVEITRFLVEARYNWGLRNVVKGNLATTTEIKTRTFAILFGVRFN